MRSELATAIRARVEGLVDELVERVLDRVEGQITDALEAARSALESDLAHRDVKPQNISSDDVSSRPAAVSSQTAATASTRVRSRAPSSDTSPDRKPNTCRKCGAVGFTARSCGKTHNVPSAPAGGARDDEEAPVGPAASTPRRQSRPPAPAELIDEDDTDDESGKTQSPPLVARVDRRERFAAIEESAARRRGELPDPRTTFEF